MAWGVRMFFFRYILRQLVFASLMLNQNHIHIHLYYEVFFGTTLDFAYYFKSILQNVLLVFKNKHSIS